MNAICANCIHVGVDCTLSAAIGYMGGRLFNISPISCAAVFVISALAKYIFYFSASPFKDAYEDRFMHVISSSITSGIIIGVTLDIIGYKMAIVQVVWTLFKTVVIIST